LKKVLLKRHTNQ